MVRKRVEREGTGGEGKKEQGEKISFTELYSFTHQSLIRMRNVHRCKFYFFLNLKKLICAVYCDF